MPLGVCTTCGRAFIYESAPEKGQDHCRHCGTHLRPARLAEIREKLSESGILPAPIPKASGMTERATPAA